MLWPKAGGPKGWLKLVNIDGLKFAPKKIKKLIKKNGLKWPIERESQKKSKSLFWLGL